MHPEEDISLEELKARKYQHLADRSGPVQFNFSMKQQQQQQQQQQSEELPPQNSYHQPSSAVSGAFGEYNLSNSHTRKNSVIFELNFDFFGKFFFRFLTKLQFLA